MVEPINLNKARKARAKAQAKAQASQNRGLFGLPKVERKLTKLQIELEKRRLDDLKRDK